MSRVTLVDVLRGFALFGVVVSNVAVVWGIGAGLIPRSALDSRIGYLQAYLITGKFLALFSLLFGLSFGLYLRRARAQQQTIIPRYLRRLGLTLLGFAAQAALRPGLAGGGKWTALAFAIVWPATTFVQGITYGAGIALLWLAGGRARAVLGLLGPAGRMALTNYLSVSIAITVVAATTRTYGRVSLTVASLVGALLWLMQVAWSTWWLRRHDFGPFEWLWRRLAYGPDWGVRASSV